MALASLIQSQRRRRSYAATVMAYGPKGYWRLGDASGSSSALDLSGNGWTGTPTNVTFGGTGPLANDPDTSAAFDGSTSKINISSSFPDLASNWTVIVWFKRATSSRGGSVNDSLWSRWTSSGSQRQLYLYINPAAAGTNNNKIQVDVPYVAGILTGSTIITDTNWHMMAVTRSGNVWTLYLDGAQDGSATSATTQQTGAVPQIGRSDVSGASFSGSIDEVAAFDKALTAADIGAIYRKALGAI